MMFARTIKPLTEVIAVTDYSKYISKPFSQFTISDNVHKVKQLESTIKAQAEEIERLKEICSHREKVITVFENRFSRIKRVCNEELPRPMTESRLTTNTDGDKQA